MNEHPEGKLTAVNTKTGEEIVLERNDRGNLGFRKKNEAGGIDFILIKDPVNYALTPESAEKLYGEEKYRL